MEFVRIGQALKLEAIVRGDAPTSLASTGPGTIFKRPPWEPQCFYAAFHHRGNIVGDSFGHDALFLATDEGTFLIRGTMLLLGWLSQHDVCRLIYLNLIFISFLLSRRGSE